MRHFPIYVALDDRAVVLSGGGEAAMAKLRLLLRTKARITVYASRPAPEIKAWAEQGHLTLERRALRVGDVQGAVLFYAADEDATEDARTASLARQEGALVNIVDNLDDSAFITPAIVDRAPVTVAIGTEGAAPVLARAIKADLEARLPASLGLLARVGKSFRRMAEALPMGRPRRDFWSDYYFGVGPRAAQKGADGLYLALETLLSDHLARSARTGHVSFVGAGPGDPDLLTMRARRALDEADVVIHDRLVPQPILDLARREAIMLDAGKEGFGPAMAQGAINDLIVKHVQSGAQVVRLKSGDPTVFGRLDEELEAVIAAGQSYDIVPGITAASASVATIGQSLTKRGRNSAVRLLTGHDMKGFADHDWATLARAGEVAAIYMGKKSSRFVQGRLLMHGADRSTPITLVENASRPDQRVIATTLDCLVHDLNQAAPTGPVLTLLGLAPRAAMARLSEITQSRQEAL